MNDDEVTEIIDSIPYDFIVREIIPMRQLQDSYINWAMVRLKGDKSEVARQLGISEKTIYNRINHGDVNKDFQDSWWCE